MNLMEEWGTGIPGVFTAVASEGLPTPEITELPKSMRFTIFIKNHHPQIEATPGTDRGVQENSKPTDKSDEVGVQVTGLSNEVGVQVTDQVRTLLQRAAQAPRSRVELLSALGITSHPANVKRHIAPLLQAGWLEKTQPDSPRSPTQRYQITDTGRQVLDGSMA